jgi:uncharacterized protein (DUF1778 family)
MSRITLEVTNEQHQQIKAMASLQGKSIKDYVLEKLFSARDTHEDAAWQDFRKFVERRIEEAENQPEIRESLMDVFERVIQSKKG